MEDGGSTVASFFLFLPSLTCSCFFLQLLPMSSIPVCLHIPSFLLKLLPAVFCLVLSPTVDVIDRDYTTG